MHNLGIKRIEGKVELIPVVIDDCSIPDALKDILHVRIRDIQNYDAELDRIIDALHGEVRKPALGQAPAYSMSSLLLYLADVGDLYEKTHVNSRSEWDVGYEELRRYQCWHFTEVAT